MKRLHLYILCLIVSVLTSCSLEEDLTAFSSPKSFYKTKEQCVAGLNSCYIPLKNIYTYQFLIATEGVTDICYINSGTQDAQLDITPAKPRFGANVWQYAYQGVMYSNAALYGIENSPLSDDVKAPLMAEGKIMRAFYYYLLTSFFGDVPYYTTYIDDVETLLEVGKLPRMSAIDTRNTLIDELSECVGNLELIRSSEVKDNRVGAAMGWMLIAKMAMWNKRWDKALEACRVLEGVYGELDQYPLTDIPFRNKNTSESIFEIQHLYVVGGQNYTSNVGSICMPYPRTAESQKYSGVEIPELGKAATTWVPFRPNGYFYVSLQPAGGTDLRRDMNIVSEWNGEKFNETRPYPGPKFWCPNQQAAYDSNNHKVFRYADVLLMISECYCMMQQDVDTSMEYLNKVKRRAQISDYTKFRTWDRLMDEIQAERARELFGEFQRKFDLVRWGTWYTRTYGYNDYQKVKDNILPCHEYYPIPDTEVVYSGYALDNKAYAEYGL